VITIRQILKYLPSLSGIMLCSDISHNNHKNNNKKKDDLETMGVDGQSPIQVLTRPDVE